MLDAGGNWRVEASRAGLSTLSAGLRAVSSALLDAVCSLLAPRFLGSGSLGWRVTGQPHGRVSSATFSLLLLRVVDATTTRSLQRAAGTCIRCRRSGMPLGACKHAGRVRRFGRVCGLTRVGTAGCRWGGEPAWGYLVVVTMQASVPSLRLSATRQARSRHQTLGTRHDTQHVTTTSHSSPNLTHCSPPTFMTVACHETTSR